MEGGRLIKREAGDAVFARQRRVQGDAAAVGVADQMHLALAMVDAVDGPRRLIGQREGVRAAPGAGRLRAIVLGRKELVPRAEGIAEGPPLTGAGPRAVQGDHRVAHLRPAIDLWALHEVLRSPSRRFTNLTGRAYRADVARVKFGIACIAHEGRR